MRKALKVLATLCGLYLLVGSHIGCYMAGRSSKRFDPGYS